MKRTRKITVTVTRRRVVRVEPETAPAQNEPRTLPPAKPKADEDSIELISPR